MKKIFERMTESVFFNRFSLGVILFSSILIGVETVDSIILNYAPVIEVIDRIILAWFAFEIFCRMAAHGRNVVSFFKCPWNIFDFFIVVITLLPAVSPAFSVFRLFRIFRVLRLLSALPELQILVAALLKTLPSMGYVGLLLFLIVYVYGVLGTYLFKHADPHHFGNLGLSLLTLFQVTTLEAWAEIFWPLFRSFGWIAALFFLSYIFMGTMVLLNLLIGVVIRSMEQVQEEHARLHNQKEPYLESDVEDILIRINELKEKVKLIRGSKV